jgi:cation transport ATPase
MTIAIAAAAAIGEFFTALVITLFVLVAELLEGMTVSRGRKRPFLSSSAWMSLIAPARRTGTERGRKIEEIPSDAVSVNPGGRVPVDGTVLVRRFTPVRSTSPARLADRMASCLVYFALAAAALTFLITETCARPSRSGSWLARIAAGTPLAILGGIGRAARLGAISPSAAREPVRGKEQLQR